MSSLEPSLIIENELRVDGKQLGSVEIYLRAKGCEYRKNNVGCVFCSLQDLSSGGLPVSGMDMLQQIKSALTLCRLHNHSPQDIFLRNCGSFFSDNEIPAPVREEIIRYIAGLKQFKRITVESRPEYIIRSAGKLKKLASIIEPEQMECFIGLETSNELLRNEILNKGFSGQTFMEATGILAKNNIALAAGVMLKPPGCDKADGIHDALDTIYFADEIMNSLNIKGRIIVTPFYVAKSNQVTVPLYHNGECSPPSLWSVVEIIKASISCKHPLEVNLKIPVTHIAAPSSCPQCSKKLADSIELFNRTGDRSIKFPDCECKQVWRKSIK